MSEKTDPSGGLLRTCLACSGTDNHPRHDVITQIHPELQVSSMHLDCCAQVRGCESCAAAVAGSDGKTGDAMRDHILSSGKG